MNYNFLTENFVTRNPGEDQLPWFDLPSAHEVIPNAFRMAERLWSWVNYGYIILDGIFSEHLCDAACASMERIWASREADPAERIHNLFRDDPVLAEVFNKQILTEYASLIFNHPAHPRYSINFLLGSEQAIHQDSAVFFTWPTNYLLGAWIALEDIGPDCGPLVYYPGSHREFWQGWTDPPQTCLKTCDKATASRYYDWIEETKSKYQPQLFTAKKGDVLLWHAGLFHGGSKIVDKNSSRKSMVVHYFTDFSDVSSQCRGPFNWD